MKEKKYERVGKCQPDKCGAFCCKMGPMALRYGGKRETKKHMKYYRLYEFFGWGTETIKEKGESPFTIVYPKQECSKLTEDNSCAIYKKRPTDCQKFPEHPDHEWYKIAKKHGCTYRFKEIK